MKNWFSSWNSMLPWGQGWAFLPWNKPKACWRAKMPTPARRAAYCWVRKTSAECRATKYWRYFSIAKELSLSKYTSFPWFYWIRDFVTLQNTVFLIAKSGKEIKILSPCYARRKRKKLGTHKQLQEGKRCCKVTKAAFSPTSTYAAFALTFRKNKIEERTQENVGNRGTTVHTVFSVIKSMLM